MISETERQAHFDRRPASAGFTWASADFGGFDRTSLGFLKPRPDWLLGITVPRADKPA